MKIYKPLSDVLGQLLWVQQTHKSFAESCLVYWIINVGVWNVVYVCVWVCVCVCVCVLARHCLA